METERTIDKLAGWVMKIAVFTLICALCWYFRSVLIYILVAFVLSLMGQPVMRLLRKIKIRGKSLPDALLAIVTILAFFLLATLVIRELIPFVIHILRDASMMNDQSAPSTILNQFDAWAQENFPFLGSDFDLIDSVLDQIRSVLSFSNVTSLLGNVASVAGHVAIGLFSVVFISFFFIKDEHLFCKIVSALVPDSVESSVDNTLDEIAHLLSRYFVGLVIEMFGVILVDFLGLWLIARVGVDYAIGIAFIAGLLNIIPYVGPLLGYVIGTLLSVVLKYGAGVGLDVPVWAFALIVLAIMLTAQLIDNFIYQPLIYSTSIKSTPLEIFIVLLIAGHLGGTIGLLVGIPVYTVVRVIAARFFYKHKVVRRLMPGIEHENTDAIL